MDNKDINSCDIVQDLLPLFCDNICTPASREFVSQHLATCQNCRKTYKELNNHTIEDIIKKESVGVLERHAKKERTAAYKAGLVIAALLVLPVIITFIVTVSGGGNFGVFSVVVASMMLVAALTSVPLMSRKKRLVKTIIYGVFALLLILFFVDRMNGGGQFILWTVPTIFGLSIVLFPFVIRGIDLPLVLSDKKALITMAWDTMWLFLTIIEVCNHSGDIDRLKDGCTIAAIMMVGVWLVFLIARYLPLNAFIKSGFIITICSIWTAFANDFYMLIAEHKKQLTIASCDFTNWSNDMCCNANIYILILTAGTIASIILIVTGIVRMKRS